MIDTPVDGFIYLCQWHDYTRVPSTAQAHQMQILASHKSTELSVMSAIYTPICPRSLTPGCRPCRLNLCISLQPRFLDTSSRKRCSLTAETRSLSLPPLSASLDIHYVAHPTATQTLELDTLTAKRRTHAACAGGRHTRLSLTRGYPKGCGPRARNARQLELGSSVRRTSVVGGK